MFYHIIVDCILIVADFSIKLSAEKNFKFLWWPNIHPKVSKH